MIGTNTQAEFACRFCEVEVTVDNIGFTVGKGDHICKDCIHSDEGLKLLESQPKHKSKFLCPDCGHYHGSER